MLITNGGFEEVARICHMTANSETVCPLGVIYQLIDM